MIVIEIRWADEPSANVGGFYVGKCRKINRGIYCLLSNIVENGKRESGYCWS